MPANVPPTIGASDDPMNKHKHQHKHNCACHFILAVQLCYSTVDHAVQFLSVPSVESVICNCNTSDLFLDRTKVLSCIIQL